MKNETGLGTDTRMAKNMKMMNVPTRLLTQNMIASLQTGLCPPEMSKAKRNTSDLQAIPYVLLMR
ncbi:hypothetical protein KI387_042876, partial [Taxus chinensis]